MIKKIFENSVVKMIVSLAVVGSLSGAALVFVYNYSMPKIIKNIKTETEKAIRSIFTGAEKIEKLGAKNIYKVSGPGGEFMGYAFLAEGNGYQGTIKLIVGVDEGITEMKGMEVLESQETPGLGAEIAEAPFRDQFSGLSITHPIVYLKNQKPKQKYEIEAITGATISSRAVVNILNKRVSELRKTLKGGR